VKEHSPLHTEEKPFDCPKCDKKFTLEEHYCINTVNILLPATHVAKFRLEKHLSTHTGEKSLACTTCDKTFRMKKHQCIHTGELE
jgi:KRAB domain-containing zinc finger protein